VNEIVRVYPNDGFEKAVSSDGNGSFTTTYDYYYYYYYHHHNYY